MDSIKNTAAKGLFWGGVSNVVQQLLNLSFGIFLARILSAEDYGMVGMLTIIAAVANAIQESGFRSALSNIKNITHDDYSAVFWTSLMLGTGLYLVLFFAAPLIADFFNTPQLTSLSRFLFLGFWISSAGTAHNAYLFRNLMVKQTAKCTLTASLFSGIVAIIMAVNGMAYWGIAAQNVCYIAINTLMFAIYSDFRPTLKINLKPIKKILPYSSKLLATTIFHLINENFFTALLGKLFTRADVGYYANAYKWSNIGTLTISLAIDNIMQPLMSRANDESRLQIFVKFLQVSAFISFPAMLGLALIAPEFITITIGEKWLQSAAIMSILCVWGAFFPICQVYQKQLLSAEKSGTMLFCVVCRCVMQIVVILSTYKFGIIVAVFAATVSNVLSILILHYFVRKINGILILEFLSSIILYLISIIVAIVVAYFVSELLENIYCKLIVKIAVCALIYLLILRIFRATILTEAIVFLKEFLSSSKIITKFANHNNLKTKK